MSEFQRRLEANIRESLRFAVGEVQDDAVAHMIAGVNAVLNHPCAPAPSQLVVATEVISGRALLQRMSLALDDLSPEETIGLSNGVFWIELATVAEIREAADAVVDAPSSPNVKGNNR